MKDLRELRRRLELAKGARFATPQSPSEEASFDVVMELLNSDLPELLDEVELVRTDLVRLGPLLERAGGAINELSIALSVTESKEELMVDV